MTAQVSREQARALATAAQQVMDLLAEHGAGIIGHLLDTDNNPGQRLRSLAAKVLTDTATPETPPTRTEPDPLTGVTIPINPDGTTDWPRFAAELRTGHDHADQR